MFINVHAGHNAPGKVASGAVGYLDESEEARLIKDTLISMLQQMGHTVFDCTCDNGTSIKDVMNKIIAKCNAHTVDIDVSIHFNAYTKSDYDNKIKGTEVLVYSHDSPANFYATRTVNALSELGLTNRGVKERPDLAFLHRTKSPAMLIEVCFCDDRDDYRAYKNIGMQRICKALVYGITNEPYRTVTYSTTSYVIPENAFKVMVTCDVLNVRTGPGTKYPIKTEVKQGEVYTITETANSRWGRLLSGVGWINLKYTKQL